MADKDEKNMGTITDAEIAEWERQRQEAEAERIAPFKALRRKMDAGLRFAIAQSGVTDDELLGMEAATAKWSGAGVAYQIGDTVMYEDAMWACAQAHKSQADWAPGTATQALWRRVKPKNSNVWQPNTDYKKSDAVIYNDIAYTCLQAHTSLPGWEPPNVPALWQI